jgi:predicted aminopeptidase
MIKGEFMIKKILYIFLVLIALPIIFYFDLVIYGITMGYNQVKIVVNARPITEVMQDELVADSIKTRLRFVQNVKRFAIDSLGLTPSENYEAIFDQEGRDLLWNLSAAKKYKLEAKTWSFPFLGSFPYKGFFNLNKARDEARELAKTHDVRIRAVGGWSTLGWFSDPILSNMLERSDGSLANLIIHELTHSTLFIKDNIQFNENLASFVGDEGAKRFMRSTYGDSSYATLAYLHSDDDYTLFTEHILQGAERLDSLYSDPQFQATADSLKDMQKEKLIQEIVTSLRAVEFVDTARFRVSAEFKPNNAYFMSFRRYTQDQNTFRNEFETKFNSNFENYLSYLKKKFTR